MRFSGWLEKKLLLTASEWQVLIAHLGVKRTFLHPKAQSWTVTDAEEPFLVATPLQPRGVKVSYPRIVQIGTQFYKTFPEGRFANTAVYNKLQRWVREHTRPSDDSLRIGHSVILMSDVADFFSLQPPH